MFEKEQTLCFSGHRVILEEEKNAVKENLSCEIDIQIMHGYSFFICGGALGFDTLAALAVLKAKKENSQIKLVMALPHRSQELKWSASDRKIYQHILGNSDEIIYVSENYYRGCMLTRNRFMVDNSNLLIAYCKGTSGGTVYTYNYAIKKGIARINLSDM